MSGVSEETRAAVSRAARDAGMPVGAWIEQALRKALAEGLEPGVSIEEIEARVRAVVAQELQAVQQALARLATAGGAGNVQARPGDERVGIGQHRLLIGERARPR